MSGFLFEELMNLQKLVEMILFNTPPELRRPLEEIQAGLDRAISHLRVPHGGEDSTKAAINPVQHKRENSSKRKKLPTWDTQVRALPGSSPDRPPEDGFAWRKYGHKEILNSLYPRCYYRCTFKQSHNCPATKKAQKFDDDPTIFNVVYSGEHVCGQRALSAPPVQHNNYSGAGPSFSPATPVSLLLAEPYPASSASPFVSRVTPDESFHGSSQTGAWEHDKGDMLGGATSATSSYFDGGPFLENFGDVLFP